MREAMTLPQTCIGEFQQHFQCEREFKSWGAWGACYEGNAFGRAESYTHLTTLDDIDSANSKQDDVNNGSNEAESDGHTTRKSADGR